MEIHFGIHQELWQDAWLAATSAVRAKKRQIDLNVQQRVQRLLSDHGPGSGRALTLRVYGTMIKGFCVINNDRARVLYSDCERVVLLFAEQPYSEGLKLPSQGPAAKRQRVDAVTLDLSRVKEAEVEVFDWTQTLLAEDLLERLGPVEGLPEVQESTGWAIGMIPAMPSLMDDAEGPPRPEAFPEVPAAEATQAAQAELEVFPGELGDLEVDLPVEREPKKRRTRRILPPGHVLGFDEKITAELAEVQATLDPPGLASQAERLRSQMLADHLGPLRLLLDPRPVVPGGGTPGALEPGDFPPSESLPEIQPLLSDQLRPEMLGAIFAKAPEGEAYLEAAEQAAAAEAALVPVPDTEAEAMAFDAQTAQIGAVIRHFVEEKEGPVLLDDLMPPSVTEKITAARTFGCLLGLATGGGLQVFQDIPYGPISIAVA